MFTGKYPGIFSLGWGFVDVRDVAKAHILAMQNNNAEGRYLCCNETMLMETCVEKLRAKYPNYSLPTMKMNCGTGDALVKLTSWFQEKGTGQYLRTNIGRIPQFDNSKIKDLGLQFMQMEQTLYDCVDDCIAKGHIPAK